MLSRVREEAAQGQTEYALLLAAMSLAIITHAPLLRRLAW